MKFYYNKAFRWIGKRRGEFSAPFAFIAILNMLLRKDVYPVDLLSLSSMALLCWALLISGVLTRLYAAGTIHKNEDLCMVGIYAMIRHPLYLGTSLIYLGIFFALGDMILGVILLALMILLVYFPRILQEEESMAKKFPDAYAQYKKIPRLFPNLLRLGHALKTRRFSLKRSIKNRGPESLWLLITVPLFLKLLVILKAKF